MNIAEFVLKELFFHFKNWLIKLSRDSCFNSIFSEIGGIQNILELTFGLMFYVNVKTWSHPGKILSPLTFETMKCASEGLQVQVYKFFWNVDSLVEFLMFQSNLFHSLKAEGKKKLFKKFYAISLLNDTETRNRQGTVGEGLGILNNFANHSGFFCNHVLVRTCRTSDY